MDNLIPLQSLTPLAARELLAEAAEAQSPAGALASLTASIDWSGIDDADVEVRDLLAEAEELVTLVQEGEISLFAFKRSIDQLTSTLLIDVGELVPSRATSGSSTITIEEEERSTLNLRGALTYSVR